MSSDITWIDAGGGTRANLSIEFDCEMTYEGACLFNAEMLSFCAGGLRCIKTGSLQGSWVPDFAGMSGDSWLHGSALSEDKSSAAGFAVLPHLPVVEGRWTALAAGGLAARGAAVWGP